ncbi:MAG: hypothetical protein R6V10_02230 [bacterium]
MDYDEYKHSLVRTVAWLVVLEFDYCTHEYGQDPCTASSPPYCYYTYPTCKDPANFNAGKKEYWFSMAEGPFVPGALPYLSSIKTVPTEIRPEKEVTRRARLTVEFHDDLPLAMANPDKSASSQETAGSFFRNLIARNPNYEGRSARILQGFQGLSTDDYKLCFKGIIDSVEWEEGNCRIIIKDQLKLLDKKIPPQTSTDNVLEQSYNGGSVLYTTDGGEFEPPGCVKIDDEYVLFAGVNGDTLTGCEPGRFGSSSTSHGAGTPVKQVSVFADEDTGDGIAADEIFLSLLCSHGGISPLDIAVTDSGAVLTGAITDTGGSVPVDKPESFPETGVIRIGDELVLYRGIDGSDLQVKKRGAYGSTPSEHASGDPVYLTLFSAELGRWMSGTRYKRFAENPLSIKDLVNELRSQALVHVWQSENSTIAAKSVAPPFYTSTPKRIDDRTGLVCGSTSWEPGLKTQATRISVYYSPLSSNAGNNPSDYAGLLKMIDADAESDIYFGREKPKEVFSRWIFREHEAMLLASRYLARYGKGAPSFNFALELKDAALEVGDFVFLETKDIVDAAGAARADSLYEILRKEQRADNLVEYKAIDTSFSRRYPVIAPAELNYDYGDAEASEKKRYGWIGDADNRVGPDLEDGYYIY